VAAASGVAFEIAAAQVPLSDAARTIVAADPERLVDALTGGDDYEIVLTAPAAAIAPLAAAAAAAGHALTVVGQVIAGPAGQVGVVDATGARVPIASPGWRHF
jgi:thiamine-monophosphate kinase